MLAVFDGKNISNAIFQLSSETCAYYKFDYIALYGTTLQQTNESKQVFDGRFLGKVEKQPIEALYKKSKIKTKVFADSKTFAPENVTLFGFIDEDNMYVQGCSGGGVLTAWVVGHDDRFAAAASLCPVTNWISMVGTTDIPAWTFEWFDVPFWEDPKLSLIHI